MALVCRPLAAEIPAHRDIHDQGQSKYCSFYCMANFVRNWADGALGVAVTPQQDPGFLALGYNREFSAGTMGSFLSMIPSTMSLWGTIPMGSRDLNSGELLLPSWETSHARILPEGALERVLNAQYTHPSMPEPFTGREYMSHLGISFARSTHWKNPHPNPVKAKGLPWSGTMAFRYGRRGESEGSYDASASGLNRRSPLLPSLTDGSFDRLYERLTTELLRNHPVPTTLRVGLFHSSLEAVLGLDDLFVDGRGSGARHSILAVGACGPGLGNPLCSRFEELMAKKQITEGIIFENSYGPNAHEGGYLLISKGALKWSLDSAIVVPGEAISGPSRPAQQCRSNLSVIVNGRIAR